MKNLIAVFGTLIGCCLIGQVRSQGKKESILPITLENQASCQEILAASTFEGTCCSLSSTPAGGCLLSVIAGNCVVGGISLAIAKVSGMHIRFTQILTRGFLSLAYRLKVIFGFSTSLLQMISILAEKAISQSLHPLLHPQREKAMNKILPVTGRALLALWRLLE